MPDKQSSSGSRHQGKILVRETIPETFEEITNDIVVWKGVQYPRGALRYWTDSDLAEMNLYFVERVPEPEDYESLGYHFERNNQNKVVQVHDLVLVTPDHDDVSNERDRRISNGLVAETSTGKTVPMDTRVGYRNDVDFRTINGMASGAMASLNAGQERTFTYRGADNVDYVLTAQEVIEIGMQAMEHVDTHYKASWVIKDALDNGTLEVFYKDDSLWP